MKKIHYHVNIRIWLSLEDYYNSGISSERTKEIIEGINDPFSSCLKLRCAPAGINNNWIVECSSNNYRNAPEIVRIIQYRLDDELEDMENEK